MISISHWGMFDLSPWAPRVCVPKGFKLSDFDIAELRRPDGWIEIVRE